MLCLLRCMSLELAPFGPAEAAQRCPFIEVEQTSLRQAPKFENDHGCAKTQKSKRDEE